MSHILIEHLNFVFRSSALSREEMKVTHSLRNGLLYQGVEAIQDYSGRSHTRLGHLLLYGR